MEEKQLVDRKREGVVVGRAGLQSGAQFLHKRTSQLLYAALRQRDIKN